MGNSRSQRPAGIASQGELDALAKRMERASGQFSGVNGNRQARKQTGPDRLARESQRKLDRWVKERRGL